VPTQSSQSLIWLVSNTIPLQSNDHEAVKCNLRVLYFKEVKCWMCVSHSLGPWSTMHLTSSSNTQNRLAWKQRRLLQFERLPAICSIV
jgi:hypothetical protein